MSRVQLDPKFNRLMKRLPEEFTQPLKDAIEGRGAAVLAEAQSRCPERTGALRESIGIKVVSGGMAVIVGFGSREWPALWKKAGWRAAFTEFGTKGYNAGDTRHSSGPDTLGGSRHVVHRSTPPHPAQPFLRPAFYDTRSANLEAMRKLIYVVLQQASTSA